MFMLEIQKFKCLISELLQFLSFDKGLEFSQP